MNRVVFVAIDSFGHCTFKMKITKHYHARGVHNGGHSIRKFLVLDLFGFPTEARVSAGSGKINRKMQVNFAAVGNDISVK